MRFLHLIRSMRREGGGPAEGLRLLVDGYRQAGHSMEIATLDPPDASAADVTVPVHALGRSSKGYGYSPMLRPWLRENAGKYDAVIVDGLWQFHGFAALHELAGRVPYVVFPHGMLDPWFNRAYPLKVVKKLPYWTLVERKLLSRSRAVLFTSTLERDLAPRSFPGSRWNPVVVPYGTQGPPGTREENVAAFQKAVPALRDEPFLLFAGRLHQKKGCDLLLRAYADVQKRRALPRLVFAGPDSVGWQRRLEQLASELGITDRVLWAGMLVDGARWGAFYAAEALVLPSHQENFGIVVAEALSCSTPVLLSNQVNIYQDVLSCGSGFAEPDTLEGTARLLERWSTLDATERAAMAERAHCCWQNCFNSAHTAAAVAEVFRKEPELAVSATGESPQS